MIRCSTNKKDQFLKLLSFNATKVNNISKLEINIDEKYVIMEGKYNGIRIQYEGKVKDFKKMLMDYFLSFYLEDVSHILESIIKHKNINLNFSPNYKEVNKVYNSFISGFSLFKSRDELYLISKSRKYRNLFIGIDFHNEALVINDNLSSSYTPFNEDIYTCGIGFDLGIDNKKILNINSDIANGLINFLKREQFN